MKICRIFSRFYKPLTTTDDSSLDSDVKMEQDRVKAEVASGKKTDLLTVHQLSKSFGSFTAVKNLSFGVRHHECFGFLGINGAGKTTTFSMLIGDLMADSGDVFLGKFSLHDNMTQFRSNIGYCPQFDALLGLSLRF